MKFLYLYPHASPLRCQCESPPPLLFTQNKHRADGYWCIHVGLLTNIVTLLITSPRSHLFEIFRAKRLFGVSAFCNSASIRLQMENLTACPSIIYYPFLASESCYNRWPYNRCREQTCFFICGALQTAAAVLRWTDLFWQKRYDALLILYLTQSHILCSNKVSSLRSPCQRFRQSANHHVSLWCSGHLFTIWS